MAQYQLTVETDILKLSNPKIKVEWIETEFHLRDEEKNLIEVIKKTEEPLNQAIFSLSDNSSDQYWNARGRDKVYGWGEFGKLSRIPANPNLKEE